MNLYQKPKTILGKYKINEIAYFFNENYSENCRAVASPFGILICDVSTGEGKHLLRSPKSEVLSVAFSPEGNIIAGGKTDNTIQLWTNWNSYDGLHDKHILKGHGGSVTSVVFSPDGKMLASGSNDGTIRLWEMVCKESRAHTSREQEIVPISHKSTLEHGGVTSIVFSPDGKMLASGSNDGTIRLWESETRFGKNRCIATLDEPKIDVYPTIFISDNSRKAVTSVVFSLNDSILASGYSDGTIYLWDIRTLIPFVKQDSNEDRLFWYTNRDLSKNRIALEKKHTDSIQSLDFSFDGRTLASGSKDKTICIWDTKASQHLATLKKHTNTVFSVVFQGKKPINEDRSQYAARSEPTGIQGEQLVSESSDGSIRFWNTEMGENKKTLLGGYISNIESVVLSPNGQVLASIGNRGWRNTVIYFWDVNTREVKSTIAAKVEDLGYAYFTPDGRTFISRGEETIHFWDVNTGEMKKEMGDLRADRFSPDGRIRIDNSGILWDVNTGEMKNVSPGITGGSIYFSPDSQTLASMEKKTNRDIDRRTFTEFILHFWDVRTGQLKASSRDKIRYPKFIRFSPDSKTLVTIETEKKTDFYGYSRSEQNSGANIDLWDVDTGERKHSITHEIETFKSIQFSPDSKTLVTIGDEKSEDTFGYSRSTASSSKNIHFWDVSTGKIKSTITERVSSFNSVHFSPDSKTLVGVTASKIYFWEIETGISRKTTLVKGTSNIESIAFSRDSRLLLSVNTNKVNEDIHSDTKESKTSTFCFWDVETGEPKSTFPEEMINNIESIIFNSDKTKFASVHSDNLIRLWDVSTGKHESTFEGAQEDIASVAFSLDNRTLACGSRNGMILLWEIIK